MGEYTASNGFEMVKKITAGDRKLHVISIRVTVEDKGLLEALMLVDGCYVAFIGTI